MTMVATTVTIERHALRVAVETAAVAMSTDDLRSHLAGVHCEFRGDALITCASDGHRLVQTTVPVLELEGQAAAAFIRREDTKRLLKTLRCKKSQQSEPVRVEIGETVKVTGTFETVELENGNDEPTPPYGKVIPPRREPDDKGPGLFALNPTYLADLGLLGRLLPSANGAAISTTSAREPVRIDVGNKEISSIYLIMPMRI
ncbi:MAG: hypothetical protein WAU39_17595 [Polyangiales bacterium]